VSKATQNIAWSGQIFTNKNPKLPLFWVDFWIYSKNFFQFFIKVLLKQNLVLLDVIKFLQKNDLKKISTQE